MHEHKLYGSYSQTIGSTHNELIIVNFHSAFPGPASFQLTQHEKINGKNFYVQISGDFFFENETPVFNPKTKRSWQHTDGVPDVPSTKTETFASDEKWIGKLVVNDNVIKIKLHAFGTDFALKKN